jgi:hypothetical protein
MSQATIVSGAPFQLLETHPQCVPYEIKVPPAKFMEKGLSVCVLEDGKHGLYIDEKRGYMDVHDDAIGLAERTVNDILIAQVIYDPETHPAIFWVPGVHTEESVKRMFPDLVEQNLKSQQRWFETLVRRADAAFNKNHNMAEISDLHRAAAQFLGLERDWCDRSPGSMISCPACMTLVRVTAAICYSCKAIINEERYAKIRFAGQPMATQSVPSPEKPLVQ